MKKKEEKSSSAPPCGCGPGDISGMALACNQKNKEKGMEGDAVEDPASVFLGQRLKNGWKNSGCPWTYKLTPDRMLLPKAG